MTGFTRSSGIAVAAIACFAALPATAGADTIGLFVTSGPSVQQVDNRPCIIGDPSCHNPSDFGFTLIPPHDGTDTLSSPVYTVGQIRNIVGDMFSVGVDLNQAPGQDDGSYDLRSFSLAVNGTTMFSTSAPAVLTPINPGNGFSDASITGFDLSGLPADARLVFTASFSGGTAGREQFFLAATTGTGGLSSTPEPASLFLIGSGLMGVAFLARRRRKM